MLVDQRSLSGVYGPKDVPGGVDEVSVAKPPPVEGDDRPPGCFFDRHHHLAVGEDDKLGQVVEEGQKENVEEQRALVEAHALHGMAHTSQPPGELVECGFAHVEGGHVPTKEHPR